MYPAFAVAGLCFLIYVAFVVGNIGYFECRDALPQAIARTATVGIIDGFTRGYPVSVGVFPTAAVVVAVSVAKVVVGLSPKIVSPAPGHMQAALFVVIHAVDVGAGVRIGVHALDVAAYKAPVVGVAVVFAQVAVAVSAQFVSALKKQVAVGFFDKTGIGYIGYGNAGFEFVGERPEIPGRPGKLVVVGQAHNRAAIMQGIVVVVAGQVNAAVFFADTHSYDVMGVVAVVFVGEHYFVPLAGRPFAASYTHFSFQVIINRVLPTPVTHQGILLKGLSDKLFP